MNKFYSNLAFLTALLCLVSGAFACGGIYDPNTDSTDSNAKDSTGTTDNANELPEMNFNGYKFRVAHWQFGDRPAYDNRDLVAESENGDRINDAVYKRNMEVMEKYGFSIELTNIGFREITEKIRGSVMSGDDEFDLVYPRLYEGKALITENALVDFGEIPYIDLSADYWDSGITDSLMVNGKRYFAASDINLGDKDATAAILFSKKIVDENNIENLYKLVDDGKWTIDKLLAISADVSRDIDGNGMDNNDQWGFLGANDVAPSFFIGGGGTFVEHSADGEFVDSFGSARNIELTQKIHDMMNDAGIFYNHHTGTGKAQNTTDADFLKMFAGGHGLFFWSRLDSVTQLRDDEIDYGIIPTPKYDEDQENYISFVSQQICGLISVPVTNPDLERTGLILEALAKSSSDTLIPAYYDVTLKTKLLRDEESVKMLDLVFGNRRLDAGEVFDFGGWSSKYVEVCATDKSPVVSTYESYKSAIEGGIADFMEKMGWLANKKVAGRRER